VGRSRGESEEGFGSDSFLDVIANIIGILIILVVCAGLRAQNNTNEPSEDVKEATAALAAAKDAESNLEGDLHNLTEQIQNVSMTAAQRFQERGILAAAVAERQQALDAKRAAMESGSRERFDLQREAALAEASLSKLAKEKADADSVQASRVEIKAYPTPISQTVYGKEIHFQLKGGRVAAIPMEELLERFRSQAQQQVYRLHHQRELTDSVGPIDGFKLEYTLERVDVSDDPNHHGSYPQLQQCTFLPMAADLGEMGADATGPQSQFRTSLDGRDPRRTTVTLWTYPDSFVLFREMREELHRLGYSVAGRPLPHGYPIGASPHGSKSSAQ